MPPTPLLELLAIGWLDIDPAAWEPEPNGFNAHSALAPSLTVARPPHESRAAIVGCAKNVASTVPVVRARVEEIATIFGQAFVIVYENDSSDGTSDLLRQWEAEAKHSSSSKLHVNVFTESLRGQAETRGDALEICRNRLLDEARSHSVDYMLMLDFDRNEYLTAQMVRRLFSFDQPWSALCANQFGRYYDLWCLRTFDQWMPGDCWRCVARGYNKHACLRWRSIAPHHKPIEVRSCYGGAYLWKMPFLDSCRFSVRRKTPGYNWSLGPIQLNRSELCEPVTMNECARATNGARLWIVPSLLNSGNNQSIVPAADATAAIKNVETISTDGARRTESMRADHFIAHRQATACSSIVEVAPPRSGYGLGSILLNLATCAGAVLLNGTSSMRIRGPLGDYMGSYQALFREETSCTGPAKSISNSECWRWARRERAALEAPALLALGLLSSRGRGDRNASVSHLEWHGRLLRYFAQLSPNYEGILRTTRAKLMFDDARVRIGVHIRRGDKLTHEHGVNASTYEYALAVVQLAQATAHCATAASSSTPFRSAMGICPTYRRRLTAKETLVMLATDAPSVRAELSVAIERARSAVEADSGRSVPPLRLVHAGAQHMLGDKPMVGMHQALQDWGVDQREQAAREIALDIHFLAASDFLVGSCSSKVSHVASLMLHARQLDEEHGRQLHPFVHINGSATTGLSASQMYPVSYCGRLVRIDGEEFHGGWSDHVRAPRATKA